MEGLFSIVIILAVIVLYFLPTIIAYRKNLKAKALIATLTILFGRTGLVRLGLVLYSVFEESNNLYGKRI